MYLNFLGETLNLKSPKVLKFDGGKIIFRDSYNQVFEKIVALEKYVSDLSDYEKENFFDLLESEHTFDVAISMVSSEEFNKTAKKEFLKILGEWSQRSETRIRRKKIRDFFKKIDVKLDRDFCVALEILSGLDYIQVCYYDSLERVGSYKEFYFFTLENLFVGFILHNSCGHETEPQKEIRKKRLEEIHRIFNLIGIPPKIYKTRYQ